MKTNAAARVFLALGMGTTLVVTCTSSPEATAQEKTSLVREIDDTSVGLRWRLLKNSDHPAAPGRLMPVSAIVTQSRARHFEPNGSAARRALVIRAGDPIIVEEDSSVVRLRLEAVAMIPAVTGAVFQARLRTGMAVVSVIAMGPGRARLALSFERQP
jgi:hypothetical protein